MKRILMTILLMMGTRMAASAAEPHRQSLLHLGKLRLMSTYVRGIKTFRMVFLSRMAMSIGLGFLFFGFVMFHVGLFVYSPWSDHDKMVMAFVLTVVYLGAGGMVFYNLLSERRWLEIFHAEKFLDCLKESQQQQTTHEQV